MERQKDRQIDRKSDRKTKRRSFKQKDKKDGQTDKPTDRQAQTVKKYRSKRTKLNKPRPQLLKQPTSKEKIVTLRKKRLQI